MIKEHVKAEGKRETRFQGSGVVAAALIAGLSYYKEADVHNTDA